ncbi:tyrosine-type recombinase/integrase [Jiella avicenniae]|uniref:Site-specific integrase n=1 Tax=Jiella avicenniae TaxID=2907202 RepID=A0A9X1P414_9HYPH|nr:site-specific integrase [Jiella avicenniae]MCE7030997.1 site-specific integrase [Jiella avicenniae]
MTDLIDPQGNRLYLTAAERAAFLTAAAKAPREVRSFCEVLHFTGCRISEALALSVKRIDLDGQALVFETLKKRRSGIYRAVPVPPRLLDTLDLVHGVREAHTRRGDPLLWDWSRTTAWRHVKAIMETAGITGPHASPKGLRHGYGVAAIGAAVPLNMLSKWMGHATIETTAIYANALGEEQRSIAERMWN